MKAQMPLEVSYQAPESRARRGFLSPAGSQYKMPLAKLRIFTRQDALLWMVDP